MQDIHLMIDELAAWTEIETTLSAHAQKPPLPPKTRHQIELMRTELIHVSVMTVATASITNLVIADARPTLLLHELPAYLPDHSRFFTRTLDSLLEGDLELETCNTFQDYAARLALARSLSQHLAPRLARDGDDWHRHAANTADAWQRAASAAVRLHDRLTSILPPARNATGRTELWVVDALKSAASGDTPCIDHQGEICLPGWVERRKEKRIPIECAATLRGQGRERDVVIIDVSMRGLGLMGDALAGQAATIVLANGRLLSGKVEWSVRGRFGMFLDQPLLPCDALLSARI